MKPNIDSSVLEICFSLAPTEFRFSKYNLYLIGHRYGNLRLHDFSAAVEVTPKQATACHVFSKVCSDVYRVEIEPEATDAPTCNCKLQALCKDKCSSSVLENVNMNNSHRNCFDAPDDDDRPDQIRLITGVLVSLLLSVLFISLIGFYLRKHQPCKKKTHQGTRRKIMILYSNDIEGNLDFIRSLANFLRKYCSCEVDVGRWQEDRSTVTNVERIQSCINSSDCTVLILSRKVCLRYFDVLRGVIDPPKSASSSENLAVVKDLIKLTICTDNDSMKRKCYQVSLTPSTNSELLLGQVVEQYYELPNDIACFLKTIGEITKLSKKQKKALRKMMLSEKVTNCQPLLQAVASGESPLKPLDSVSNNNNNRFSYNDLNIEENHSSASQIESSIMCRRVSGDSAYSTISLPIGVVGEYLHTHTNPNAAVLFASNVSFA